MLSDQLQGLLHHYPAPTKGETPLSKATSRYGESEWTREEYASQPVTIYMDTSLNGVTRDLANGEEKGESCRAFNKDAARHQKIISRDIN